MLLVTVLASGCSEDSAEPTGEQATVTGKVTYDGTPVTLDSSVVFSCLDPAVTAAGEIDSLGNYTLRPANPDVGIPIGRYRVMIRPPAPPPVQMGSEEYKQIMQQGANAEAARTPTAGDIPEKFTSFDTSGIVLELKPGPNTFDFDLAKLK